MPREPEQSQQSYRLQVREFHSVPCPHCGQASYSFGDVLWEELPGDELTYPIRNRLRAAQTHAEILRLELQVHVAIGQQPLYGDGPWVSFYRAAYRAPKVAA